MYDHELNYCSHCLFDFIAITNSRRAVTNLRIVVSFQKYLLTLCVPLSSCPMFVLSITLRLPLNISPTTEYHHFCLRPAVECCLWRELLFFIISVSLAFGVLREYWKLQTKINSTKDTNNKKAVSLKICHCDEVVPLHTSSGIQC